MTAQPSAVGITPAGTVYTARSKASHNWRALTAALVAGDAIALVLAFSGAYLLRFKLGLPLLETPTHSLNFYSSVAFWAIPIWLGLFALYRLYDRHYLFVGLQEYIRLVNASTVGLLAVIVVSFVDVTMFISRGWLLIVWVLSVLLVGAFRFAARRVVRGLREQGAFRAATVIVGANEEGTALAEQFLADRSSGIQLLGFIDDGRLPGTPVTGGLTNLGGLEELDRMVRAGSLNEVVVATTALPHRDLLDIFRTFGHVEGVEIRLSSGLFEILTTGVRVQELSYVPLMTPQRVRITGVDAFLKSVFDYTAALAALVLLSPVLLAVAILVKRDSPGPVFYRRRVLGRGGRPFDALKFRTMVVDAEARLAADQALRDSFSACYKLKEDPRVTRLGRFLRRTSIDELPQLVNVLRGEMSLVGPRMIAPDEAERYGKWQLNLLTVKPGITGPWQVWGRNDLPYEERVRLSMHYIRNYTIWLDLAILFRTVLVVLRCDGAY